MELDFSTLSQATNPMDIFRLLVRFSSVFYGQKIIQLWIHHSGRYVGR